MTINHQWTTFQKGRLKINACACCGEMNLSSNVHDECLQSSFLTSPICKAGYTISNDHLINQRTPRFFESEN